MEQLDINILLRIFDFAYEQKQTGKDAEHCRDFFEVLVRSPLLTKQHLDLLKEISAEVQKDKSHHTRKRLLENLQQVRRRINLSFEKVYGEDVIYIKNIRAKNWQLVINDNFLKELQHIPINDTHNFLSDWCTRNKPALSIKTTGKTEMSSNDRGSELSRYRKGDINQNNEITKTDFQKIEIDLQKLLKEVAESDLSEKLHNIKDDYCPLAIEIGSVPVEKKNISALHDPEFSHRPEDHNRSWNDFDSNQLLSSQDVFILSSEPGAGKTTLLRYLQLRIIEQGHFLPIYLQASELEDLSFDNIDDFIPHLVRMLKLKLPTDQGTKVFKKLFNNIKLLVDGLDQIEGSGTDYSNLLANLVKVFKKNLIIASRPFAVISQEEKEEVKFLRLKPFDKLSQENYFGNFYGRAKELCISCPELIAIPMLAYMVRTLVKKGKDKEVKNRAGLYKRFIDYIVTPDLEEGYKHDNIKSNTDIQISVRHVLAEISFESFATNKPHIQKIPSSLYGKYIIPPYKTVENILKHGLANLIVSKTEGIDKCLYFSHQSFQEYLAAEWAHESGERIQQVLYEMWNPKWKKVIEFLAGLGKEDFIKRIYSPGQKDNCIHSRLFLAADCCREVSEEIQIECFLFSELTKIFHISPFEKDTAFAISQLNTSDTVDFLVELLPNWDKFLEKPKNILVTGPQSILIDTLKNISSRLQPYHAEKIIDYIIVDKEIFKHFGKRLLHLVQYSLSPELFTKLFDLACANSEYRQMLYSLPVLAKYITYEHINKTLDLCKSNSIDHREAGFQILSLLFSLIKPLDKYVERIIDFYEADDPDLQTRSANILSRIGTKLSPDRIDRLFMYLKNKERSASDVLSILNSCVDPKDISIERIDKLICLLSDSDSIFEFRMSVIDTIVHWYNKNKEVLSLAQVAQIADLLEAQDEGLKLVALYLIGNICDQQHYHYIKRAVSMINEDDAEQQFVVMMMYHKFAQRGHAKLVAEMLDFEVIINLMKSDDVGLSLVAVMTLEALRGFLKDNHITQIITSLRSINRSLNYIPLPTKLSKTHMRQVLSLLDSENEFAQRHAIQILIEHPLKSTEYIDSIISFLPRCNPEAVDKIFLLLSKIPRLSYAQLKQIDLNIVNPDKKNEVIKLLRSYPDSSVYKTYKLSILALLEEKNSDAWKNSLIMLKQLPELVTPEVLTKIINFFENNDESLQPELSGFLSKFSKLLNYQHIDQIMTYLSDEKTVFYAGGFVFLIELILGCKSCRIDRTNRTYIDTALKFLESGDVVKWNRAFCLLYYTSSFLVDGDVSRIIERQVNNSHRHLGCMDLHLIPISINILLNQINMLLAFLKDKDSTIRQRALEFLLFNEPKLEESYNKVISRLLNDPEQGIRESAYKFLKKCYSISN